MLDLSTIKKHDSQGMHNVYDKWAEIAKESFESVNDLVDLKNTDHIIFAGMGGSGTICDILSSILYKSNIHTEVVKGYYLPSTVDPDTLVITISVGGNTKETLEVLKSAVAIGCKVVAFSSGGKMQEYCNDRKITYQKIDMLQSPRASFTSFLYSILGNMGHLFNITKNDVIESITHLENLQKQISSSNLDHNNPSLNLSEWIVGIPLIYYPKGLQAAAIRFKNSLHENAKIHAFTEDIVEASHNQIVSWEIPSYVQPILIQGQDDHEKTRERWKILKEYFMTNNIDYREVYSVQGNLLSKLVNLIYLLDYCSLYRSFLSKIDPAPINSINYIKTRMTDLK